ncbi:MAG: hypothetical protein R3C05_09810 [Pirellulaceae bacterium]
MSLDFLQSFYAGTVIMRSILAFILLLLTTLASEAAEDAARSSSSSDLFERSGWAAFASDGAECSVKVVSSVRGTRTKGIQFQSESGFDTGIRWTADSDDKVRVRSDDWLIFWLRVETKNNFQIAQPVVVMGFRGGTVRYRPEKNVLKRNRWIGLTIPLSGNSTQGPWQWIRETTGTPDLSQIEFIEIHHDVWNYGIDVFYDGLEFVPASRIPVSAHDDPRITYGIRRGGEIEMAYTIDQSSEVPTKGEIIRERFAGTTPLPDLQFVRLARDETSRFIVQPYYLYPRDQQYFAAYEEAVNSAIVEVQEWYREKCGLTFRMEPLKVVQSKLTYQQMKWGGREPSESSPEMPNWQSGVLESIGGLRDETIVWIFAQGGGGWAGGNLVGNFRGYAIFGDWVLEPISGVTNPDGIPASKATWQVEGGVPMGTTVHELGHAFGLHHPDRYGGKSIMGWHGDYPETGFLAHEILILQQCPFFTGMPPSAIAPFPDFATNDVVRWEETIEIPGQFLQGTTEVELVTANGKKTMKPQSVTSSNVKVTIPLGSGPGYLRLRNSEAASHGVPVNVYPPE